MFSSCRASSWASQICAIRLEWIVVVNAHTRQGLTHCFRLKESATTLHHVNLFLVEDVLETLLISEDGILRIVQIVSLYFRGKNYNSQLKVIVSIVILVHFNLSGFVRDNFLYLHQYAPQSFMWRVAIYDVVLCSFRMGYDWCATQHLFFFQKKASFFFLPSWTFTYFCVNTMSGLAILEKLSMNLW